MISVVIPSRNEPLLQQTIDHLLKQAAGEIEIIVVLDGYWPDPQLKEDKRVRLIHRGEARGMRAGINDAVAIARGEYILKSDAHCLYGPSFDRILIESHQPDWVQVPRRKRLDGEKFEVQDVGKPDIDYMYLAYPDDPNDFGGAGLNGKNWDEKNRDVNLRSDTFLVDDLMSSQGSCWFMTKDLFHELELMDEENYGTFWNEFQEIGLKAWLSGKQVKVNKRTWYAHLHKGKKWGRGYHLPEAQLVKGRTYTMNWFGGMAWHKQTKPLSWLIERFWPVPTWDEDKLRTLKELERTRFQLSSTEDKLESDHEDPEVASLLDSNPKEEISQPEQAPYNANIITLPQHRSEIPAFFRSKGFKVGAEVGVAGGHFSEMLCQGIPNLKLYCIDPWHTVRGNRRGGSDEKHENNFNLSHEKLDKYNVEFIRDISMNAVSKFEDESLDFVFIDGNHDFDFVMEDIIAWTRKVKPGGIVSGHDFYHFKRSGVVEAVTAYCNFHRIGINVVGENRKGDTDNDHPCWWFVKS